MNSNKNNLLYLLLARGRKNKWIWLLIKWIFYWASSSPASSFVHHAVFSKRCKIRCSRKTVCTNISKTFLPFLSFVLSFSLSFLFFCCCCSCCCCCCCYQTFNKEPITTWYATRYKEFITVFTSLYQRMKKLSYTLSCIKQNVFYFSFLFPSSVL